MARYDYASLSPQDFEELSRDLLQAEWGVALEAFKTGRDSGIDLRHAPADGGKTIIQCKHYVGSGYGKLLSHLRDIERPKVERLRPSRYVVVTSVALTPGNKDELCEVLKPFVIATSDIIGSNDIEGLLARHPEVERANFKLWLTSTSVIERVLHNAEICHTEFHVARIRHKLPLFVQTRALLRAQKILDDNRLVVVSGAPGIGKTTLADILLYTHLEQGFEPIVIQAEIDDGRKLYKSGARQIFYYDDFLGQTFLRDRPEYLGRNQDAALVDFMQMIRGSEHARFILTTREHILRSALQASERLSHSFLTEYKCMIELGDYAFGDKARILYNHLYFSELSLPYKEAVLRDDFFLRIIKHKHFNPRLIEWLSTQARLRDVEPDAYQAHVSALLDNPEAIWNHAFHNQISDAARSVLLSFYTLSDWGAQLVDLETAFRSLHRHSAAKYHRHIAAEDFRSALQELDGAFLTYRDGAAQYLNPSVREFVGGVISSAHEIGEDLMISATRFKQVAKLWQLSSAHPTSELRSHLTSSVDLTCDAISRLSSRPSTRQTKGSDGSVWITYIDMDEERQIGFLADLSGELQSEPLALLAIRSAEKLVLQLGHHVPDFADLLGLLKNIAENEWLAARDGKAVYRKLLDRMLENICFANANDWLEILDFTNSAKEWLDTDEALLKEELENYRKRGVGEDRSNCTTLGEMNELREALDQLRNKYGLDLGGDIERLEREIAEREEGHDRLEGGSGRGAGSTPTASHVVTDDAVRQMFGTLAESR